MRGFHWSLLSCDYTILCKSLELPLVSLYYAYKESFKVDLSNTSEKSKFEFLGSNCHQYWQSSKKKTVSVYSYV